MRLSGSHHTPRHATCTGTHRAIEVSWHKRSVTGAVHALQICNRYPPDCIDLCLVQHKCFGRHFFVHRDLRPANINQDCLLAIMPSETHEWAPCQLQLEPWSVTKHRAMTVPCRSLHSMSCCQFSTVNGDCTSGHTTTHQEHVIKFIIDECAILLYAGHLASEQELKRLHQSARTSAPVVGCYKHASKLEAQAQRDCAASLHTSSLWHTSFGNWIPSSSNVSRIAVGTDASRAVTAHQVSDASFWVFKSNTKASTSEDKGQHKQHVRR
jgi:hypothetical protein